MWHSLGLSVSVIEQGNTKNRTALGINFLYGIAQARRHSQVREPSMDHVVERGVSHQKGFGRSPWRRHRIRQSVFLFVITECRYFKSLESKGQAKHLNLSNNSFNNWEFSIYLS